MSEAPEIPEASDSFGKKVAITIAIFAVALTFIGNKGDNAKTDAILKTNEAANQWGYYQAKSLKQNLAETEARLLTLLQPAGEVGPRETAIAKAAATVKRYEEEKQDIKKEAEALVAAAAHNSKINDRCDHAALPLQLGVVICSVGILSRWRLFWFIGIALGLVGIAIGATAFTM
ncbi:MAG: hypothetical protein RLZZ350_2336 [Verrucomicrobiota bacterium]|jgi:hypothetical protein